MATAVIIEEQGLRDGFQNEAKCAPTDFKLAVIDALSRVLADFDGVEGGVDA